MLQQSFSPEELIAHQNALIAKQRKIIDDNNTLMSRIDPQLTFQQLVKEHSKVAKIAQPVDSEQNRYSQPLQMPDLHISDDFVQKQASYYAQPAASPVYRPNPIYSGYQEKNQRQDSAQAFSSLPALQIQQQQKEQQIKEQIDASMRENEQLQKTNSLLQQIKQLSDQLRAQQLNKESLQRKLDEQLKVVQQLTSQNELLAGQLRKVNELCGQQKEQIERLEGEKQSYQREISTINTQNAANQEEQEKLSTILFQLQNDKRRLLDENEELSKYAQK